MSEGEKEREIYREDETCFCKERKKKRGAETNAFYLGFGSSSCNHVFEFGDTFPLCLQNRAGKSLGSTSNR